MGANERHSYGERGSVVIHQTLFTIFPPKVMAEAQKRFAPLAAQMFTNAVLVPEAALLLIMDDKKLERPAALKMMRASSRYGALMFPDDEDNEDGVGDALMRERARKRRIEIEQEEREERAVERAEKERLEREQSASTIATNIAVDVDVEEDFQPPRKKAEPLFLPDSDASSVSMKSKASTMSRRKAGKSATITSALLDVEMTDAPVPTVRPPAKAKSKRPSPIITIEDSDADVSSTSVRSSKPAKQRVTAKRMNLTQDSDDDGSAGPLINSKRKPTQGSSTTTTSRTEMSSPPIDLTSDVSESNRRTTAAHRRTRTRSRSDSTSSSGSSVESMSSVVEHGLQHQPTPPKTFFSSQHASRSQPGRSPSPSENHLSSQTLVPSATSSRTGRRKKLLVSQPPTVSADFATPRKGAGTRTRMTWDGDVKPEMTVKPIIHDMDQRTPRPRSVLSQRSNK